MDKEVNQEEEAHCLLLPDEEYGNGFQNEKEQISKIFGIRP